MLCSHLRTLFFVWMVVELKSMGVDVVRVSWMMRMKGMSKVSKQPKIRLLRNCGCERECCANESGIRVD